MISEIKFIRDYTSFWRTISPLSEDFVRQINLSVLNRYESELHSISITSRIALINEVGFEIFSRCREKNLQPNMIPLNEVLEIAAKVSFYISQLRNGAPLFKEKMAIEEINEAQELASRLLKFFQKFEKIMIKPRFLGCGRLDSCQGDIIADNILYEIKSGNRPFKSVDLRQLLLYLSLNHYSKQYEIQRLGLYNPRKGFHFEMPHEEFSIHFSGLSTEELCHRVCYELTTVDLGRFDPYC